MKTVASTLLFAALVTACASARTRPHDGVRELWADYRELTRHKAIAIAGDPDRNWVAGAVGGFESPGDAQRAALAKCAEKRRDRRIQVPCRLYATGERIIW